MRTHPQRVFVVSLLAAAVATSALATARTEATLQTSPAPPFKIVVIEGEGGVNVVQQRTAVTPLIEVRDRNDQPVSGAAVTFAIRSGRATFSGARALTVTTNTAGRAVAAGLTPTGSGALQISASALVQGQTVTATIAQVNVMTAAQASALGASAGASGGAGGASAGAGGAATSSAGAGAAGGSVAGAGLPLTTIGIVGAAAAGGTIAAAQVLNDPKLVYTGTVSNRWQKVFTLKPSGATCTSTLGFDGTATLRLDSREGNIHGTLEITGSDSNISTTCGFGPPPGTDPAETDIFDLTGTRDRLTLQFNESGPIPGGDVQTVSLNIVASIGDDTATVAITYTESTDGPFVSSTGTQQISATLR